MGVLTNILWEAPIVPWPQKSPPKKPTTPKVVQLLEIVVEPQSKLSTVTGHLTLGPFSAREGTLPPAAVLQAKGKDFYLSRASWGFPQTRLMLFCRLQTCLSWLCEGCPWSSAPAGKCPCALLSSQQFCFPVPVNTLGCQAQCQLQQGGSGSTAAFCLQPGDPGTWQESQAVLPDGQTSHPCCQEWGGPSPSPHGHEPCPLLWQFWHHWPLLRQFNFLKCQKGSPSHPWQVQPSAGLVSYVIPWKDPATPRTGWEKALWAALLVGMSWCQLQQRLSSGIPEN